eukprot:Nk52_evm55s1401 gene=Nk52_evmTU55s1401
MFGNNNLNILYLTDSYKVSHHQQYPPKTEMVYSYLEARGGEHKNVVFFGLQYILKRYFVGEVVTNAMIDEAKEFYQAHFGNTNIFNECGWRHIVKEHKGRLPVKVRAVPEGTVVNVKNAMLVIENTDPKCYWLPNYMETVLMQVWYPITVCTYSRSMKQEIKKYMELSAADSMGNLPFKLHDFGYRGVSSVETAAIGGAAHLVNFMGSDTVAGVKLIREYYQEPMAGFSIPAAEHSTITSWGKEREIDACRNMLEQYPTGLVAVVSDSYDIWKCCSEIWGTQLKSFVENRDGTLVVRPDSGDPATVVLKVLGILGDAFGYTVNSQGFKVLPSYVRVIQGDGIHIGSLKDILEKMMEAEWSADNVGYGSGGALLQRHTRDTCKFAMKCSFCIVDGKPVNVFKDPITDPGKKSKKGRLSLQKGKDIYGKPCFVTVEETPAGASSADDEMVTVFENGKLLVDYSFADIRKRAAL